MLAKGISFQIGNAGSPTEVFTQIAGITDIDYSGTSWDTEETTSHDSPEPVRTARPTVRTDGEITLVILHDPSNTQHALLKTLSTSGTARNFKITYPNSTLGTFTFSGYITAYKFDTPKDGTQKTNVSILVNGSLSDAAARIASLLVTDSQMGAYLTGETMRLTATFDEYVKVTGTPRIAVVLDSGTVYATYSSGAGSNVLAFTKVFGGGDQANATEVSITSPIDLNGGSIKDMSGQNATLTFTPPDTSAFTVNPS